MSDKSNKYGYVGTVPSQSFGANKGVFNPAEINELVKANQWTTFGQLELIETQDVTSYASYVEFTNLGNYNVHFLTYNNVQCTLDGLLVGIQFSVGGTYVTSGYQFAFQYGSATGTFGESQSTSFESILIALQTGTASNEKQNGYSYLYNLTDSSKYSFTTTHSMGRRNIPDDMFYFGGGVYPTANQVDKFRVVASTSTSTIDNGVFSLYGIRYS